MTDEGSVEQSIQAAAARLEQRKKNKGSRRSASEGMHAVSIDFDYASNRKVAGCATCGLRWSGPDAHIQATDHMRETSAILGPAAAPQEPVREQSRQHGEQLGQWGEAERYWPDD